MSENLLDTIKNAWGWVGLSPKQVVASNAFGNLLVEDESNRYWRICPEELLARVVAENEDEYGRLLGEPEFLEDWEMLRLVQIAHSLLGAPGAENCFCLKVPAVLGGDYDANNFGTISRDELISFSGDLAFQIKDLPDGAEVRLQIVD